MTVTSTIPLWGRAWKLSVKTADGNVTVLSQSGWDPEALRVQFDVLQTTLPSPFWFASVNVFNLNDPAMQNLLFNAVWLTLEAGFQTGPSKSSTIWDGPVLQVMFDRQDVTDLIINFNCVIAPAIIEQEFVNVALGPQSSQYLVVSKMIAQLGGNVSEQVSEKAAKMLQAKQYPRGKTIFGQASRQISDIADDNFLNHWISGNQKYVSELFDPNISVVPNLVYGPPFPPGHSPVNPEGTITRSIIGVPRQNQFGAIFNVLLDPRLKVQLPPLLVKLDQTVITQQKIEYGQVITPLDHSGLFVAGQVHHYGDTRGGDWATEVTGFTRGYAQGLLEGTFLAQSAGSVQ